MRGSPSRQYSLLPYIRVVPAAIPKVRFLEPRARVAPAYLRASGGRPSARPPRQPDPLLEREMLLRGHDRRRAERLGKPDGAEGDLACLGPVQANSPAVV